MSELRDELQENPEIGIIAAEGIYEIVSKLDGIGVFNSLATLRDEPELAKEIIREGFVER